MVGVLWLAAVVAFVLGIVFADDVVSLDSGAVLDRKHGLGATFGDVPGFAGFMGLLAVFVMTVAAAVSLVGRYRRATGLLRQQLKWFGGAASVLAAVVVSAPLAVVAAGTGRTSCSRCCLRPPEPGWWSPPASRSSDTGCTRSM